MTSSTAQRLAPFAAVLAFIALWELTCKALSIPVFVLPAPSAVFAAFLVIDWASFGVHIWTTLQIVIVGFGISILFSIPVSLLLAGSPLTRSALMPILIIIHSMPIVAIAPIIIVSLGPDLTSKAVITCLISYFPMVISTTTGLLAAPPEMIDLSRSLRGTKGRELMDIRLPFAVPYIFGALKVASTLAVVGAVVGEFVSAEKGLGYLILFSTSLMRVPQAFTALFFLIIMSLVLYWGVVLVQRVFFSWSLST